MLKIVREFVDKDTMRLARVGTYLTGKSEERENELVKKGLAIKIKETKVEPVQLTPAKTIVEEKETKPKIIKRK